jgi:hypothetical protein
VVADPRLDAGGRGAPLNHPISVLLPHGVGGQLAGLACRRAEEQPVRIAGNAGGGDVLIEVLIRDGPCAATDIILYRNTAGRGVRDEDRETAVCGPSGGQRPW